MAVRILHGVNFCRIKLDQSGSAEVILIHYGIRYFTNTLRPRQNGRHFADDIFEWLFVNENVWIPIKISLKFVPQGPINNIPALVQIMTWRRPGDKPLSGSMMVRLPTRIWVTRPQWVKKRSFAHDWRRISSWTLSLPNELISLFKCPSYRLA